MSHLLPRFRRAQAEHERRSENPRHNHQLNPILDTAQVDRVVAEARDPEPIHSVTAGGDKRRLRGIPVCTFGVQGTAPGTDPIVEVLRRLRRAEYP